MPTRMVRPAIVAACLLLLVILFPESVFAPGPAVNKKSSAATFTSSNPPSQTALDCFYTTAFSGEYGDTERNRLIKWNIPLSIFIQGEMTDKDRRELDAFLYDLKEEVPGLPDIGFASSEESANVTVSFVPYSQMKEALTYYVSGNWGFENCFSDNTTIQKGLIAIACDVTSQEDRNQMIREEFVNMLGLTNDLSFTPESILYQGYNSIQTLAQVDYDMLNLLYSPYMSFGMNLEEAKAKLKEIFKGP